MRRPGFTLIELMVVLAVIATLLTLALPRYFASLERSKEAVLKENLYQMRDLIGKYYADKGKYPESIEVLVTEKYLRTVPVDAGTEGGRSGVGGDRAAGNRGKGGDASPGGGCGRSAGRRRRRKSGWAASALASEDRPV